MNEKFQNRYRIESNRWQFWNYSAPGSYFITICIEGRDEILGKVINAKMQLSEFGQIAASEFLNIPKYHKRVKSDRWVVMPNHVHCIITLGDWDYDNGMVGIVGQIHEFDLQYPSRHPYQSQPPHHDENNPPTITDIKQYRALRRQMIIPKILGKYQMLTSKQMNIRRNTPGRKNWQHDYYDHVIRNHEEYARIDQYIINNPRKWDEDRFNTTIV
jgi:REP element-mobilizing transposase RayT